MISIEIRFPLPLFQYGEATLSTGYLYLKVIRASNVASADFSCRQGMKGSSDPYAIITVWPFLPNETGMLETKTKKTPIIYENLNPVGARRRLSMRTSIR